MKSSTQKPLPPEIQPHFNLFWEQYPRKVSKPQAERAFLKSLESVHVDQIMECLKQHMLTSQWLKDGGMYVPYPASWLNSQPWHNSFPVAPPAHQEEKLIPIQLQIHHEEYKRILERMRVIRYSYDEHQTMTVPDKQELSRLRERRNQLRVMLNITL